MLCLLVHEKAFIDFQPKWWINPFSSKGQPPGSSDTVSLVEWLSEPAELCCRACCWPDALPLYSNSQPVNDFWVCQRQDDACSFIALLPILSYSFFTTSSPHVRSRLLDYEMATCHWLKMIYKKEVDGRATSRPDDRNCFCRRFLKKPPRQIEKQFWQSNATMTVAPSSTNPLSAMNSSASVSARVSAMRTA